MISKATISHKAWAAFALSATFLLVFAFVGAQQIRERPAPRKSPVTEQAIQKNFDESSDHATEVAHQGRNVAPQFGVPAPKTDEAPESAVKELVQAWNEGDADKIAELFLSDGVLRLPTGSEIKSREEIRNTIAKHHDGMLKETRLRNSIEEVYSDSDKAVVKGNYQLEGIKVLGFSTSSAGIYEFHGIKRDGRWLIAKAEVTQK